MSADCRRYSRRGSLLLDCRTSIRWRLVRRRRSAPSTERSSRISRLRVAQLRMRETSPSTSSFATRAASREPSWRNAQSIEVARRRATTRSLLARPRSKPGGPTCGATAPHGHAARASLPRPWPIDDRVPDLIASALWRRRGRSPSSASPSRRCASLRCRTDRAARRADRFAESHRRQDAGP